MVSTEKILAYIERNKISDNAFEQMCGLPKASVYKWRTGFCKPGLTALVRISDSTKIPIKKWLDDKD